MNDIHPSHKKVGTAFVTVWQVQFNYTRENDENEHSAEYKLDPKILPECKAKSDKKKQSEVKWAQSIT